MGIDIIRLGQSHSTSADISAGMGAEMHFQEYALVQPQMSIAMMFANSSQGLFPWWSYSRHMDDDLSVLQNVWSVNNQQGLFDCLFLASMKKVIGNNFFVVFPGTIKTQNWAHVQPSDRTAYLSGQACIYHLHGDFQKKLSIQWVPFWQPQSLVKAPSFFSMWRLFQQISSEDNTRCITFFELSDLSRLPSVINLLNDAEEKRSEKLSELVDWFGMYSSPVQGNTNPGLVTYAKEKEKLNKFSELKKQFEVLFQKGQKALSQNTDPKTALRFLSGHIAL